MSSPDNPQTIPSQAEFDLKALPPDALIHDRRGGDDRRRVETPGPANRRRKDRRRRVDPTTFEKQYTPDELEFMNAMQRYKAQSGKAFPSHGEVLRVALSLGYRQPPRVPYPGTEEGRGGILAGSRGSPDDDGE